MTRIPDDDANNTVDGLKLSMMLSELRLPTDPAPPERGPTAAGQEPGQLRLQRGADHLQGPGASARRRRRMAQPGHLMPDLRPARRGEKPSCLGDRAGAGGERHPGSLYPDHGPGAKAAGGAA